MIRLYGMVCGWLGSARRLFLEDAEESARIRVPVPAYLVLHPEGAAVFDSGMHPSLQTEPQARIGFLAEVFDVEYRSGEELSAQLERLDVDPARVRYLVNSHLHFDHAGGNAQLPNARFVLQRREWEAGHDPELLEQKSYLLDDFDLGQDRLEIDGEHDLFGDGSVTCIPTFGHTPGHQSLRVRLPSGDVVLTGDACYLRRTLEELRLPMVVHDREAMLASLHRLRDLRRRGAQLIFGHDPDQWPDENPGPREIV